MNIAFALILAFILGSIPFGLFIGKLYGVDVRTLGSKSIGATNVYRNLGKIPGILTLLFDLLKGVLAVELGSVVIADANLFLNFAPLVGLAAILGHCYSPFLGLKGGKGVATSLGVFFYFYPQGVMIAVLSFILVFYVSRYVSLASILSTTVFLVLVFILNDNDVLKYSISLTWIVIVVRHMENIKRLLSGQENRFSRS